MSGPARPKMLLSAERLVSQQPLDRFTRGLFLRVASSLLLSIGLFRYTWVTPNERANCHVQK